MNLPIWNLPQHYGAMPNVIAIAFAQPCVCSLLAPHHCTRVSAIYLEMCLYILQKCIYTRILSSICVLLVSNMCAEVLLCCVLVWTRYTINFFRYFEVLFPSTEKIGEFFNYSIFPPDAVDYFSSLINAVIRRKKEQGSKTVSCVENCIWRHLNLFLYDLAKLIRIASPGTFKVSTSFNIPFK